MTKIALAQINTTVGDITGNAQKIRTAAHQAQNAAADIILFPELALLGYPPRDLLGKEHLVEACEAMAQELAREFAPAPELLLVLPTPRRTQQNIGTGIANSIALARGGEIIQWYDKRLLPTYDVFDEQRYFDPGKKPGIIKHAGQRIGITICEDLWINNTNIDTASSIRTLTTRQRYAVDTVAELKALGIDLLLNASASPYRLGIPEYRRNLFQQAAQRLGVPLAYTNLVGGNDDLIFDGHSGIITPDNPAAFELAGFQEDTALVELAKLPRATATPPNPNASTALNDADLNQIFHALTLGIRDYLRKCNFRDVWIALSGGIDSALVAALAVAAIGPAQVRGVGLPSRYSSAGSVTDAAQLAQNLGIKFEIIPIEPAHTVMTEALAELFAQSTHPPGVAEENIQARIRGNIMMALSNKFGSLLLTTGNKSEIAVGYCTLYGDMAGGLAVISDLPKTTVYQLSHYLNDHAAALGFSCPPIPANTLTKPPSAELRPDQKDQDTLPPYEILDEIILRYVEQAQAESRIIDETGFEPETVRHICRLIDRNEYKRRQMPTGLKITARAFGSGWRMPIAAKINGYS